MTDDSPSGEEYWDGRYSESDRMWSGNPNPTLLKETADLEPGHALELGSGEGADAVWLARQGWRVTATDISGVALERAAGHAAEAGVADRIEWQRHDLAETFPTGTFDLVTTHFLHTPGQLLREEILCKATAAVAPGGILLIVSHAGAVPAEHAHTHDMRFPTPEEILESLRLPEGRWEVLRCEEHERLQKAPEGRSAPHRDSTVKLRRLPA